MHGIGRHLGCSPKSGCKVGLPHRAAFHVGAVFQLVLSNQRLPASALRQPLTSAALPLMLSGSKLAAMWEGRVSMTCRGRNRKSRCTVDGAACDATDAGMDTCPMPRMHAWVYARG